MGGDCGAKWAAILLLPRISPLPKAGWEDSWLPCCMLAWRLNMNFNLLLPQKECGMGEDV